MAMGSGMRLSSRSNNTKNNDSDQETSQRRRQPPQRRATMQTGYTAGSTTTQNETIIQRPGIDFKKWDQNTDWGTMELSCSKI